MKPNKREFMKICIFLFYYTCLCNSHEAYGYDYDVCTCRISTQQRDFNELQPLILHSTGAPSFLYPEVTNPSAIEARVGETKLRLACPADSLTVRSAPLHLRTAYACCLNRTTIRLGADSNDVRRYFKSISYFREIGCAREQLPTARPHESRHCPGGCCIEIGFPLNTYDFLPTIEILSVDPDCLQPLVAYVQIVPVIEARQQGRSTWSFRRGPIFRDVPYNLHEIYRRDYQRKRFLEIFRDAQVANKYIPEVGDSFLIEGQLVTERDFYYKVQQSSAYFYENVVPIWRSVAYGNWELAAEFVRKLASDSATGLHVWSGTIGVLALPDYQGHTRRIFLVEGRNGRQIPVPKLLYKYVYDEQRHRGLVLVTINDPYLIQGFSSDLMLCRDKRACQTQQPSFMRVDRGYTYCCTLEAFARVAQSLNLPTFPGAGSFA